MEAMTGRVGSVGVVKWQVNPTDCEENVIRNEISVNTMRPK